MSSFDVERAAAALFSSNDALLLFFREGVREEHFFDQSIRRVYAWSIDYLRNHGDMIEAPAVELIMHEFPYYKDMVAGASPVKASYAAEQLKSKFAQSMVEEVIKGSMLVMSSSPHNAVSALLDGSAAIKSMTMRRTASLVYGKDDDMQNQMYDERHIQDNKSMGAPFPIQEMQAHTGGIRKGEVWPLVGLTGIGKTYWACAQALAAARAGWNVYFAELEMSVADISERIDVLVDGNISPAAYDAGALPPAERARIRDARKKAADLPGKIVIESPPRNERSVQHLIARATMHDADLVIIDQLQFITRSSRIDQRTEQVEDIVQELKETVSSDAGRKFAVLLPAQFNREKARTDEAGLGALHQIGMSTAIEQIADGVISIGRSAEMEYNELMNVGFLKFRRGPKKAWQLSWQMRHRFHIEANGEMPLEN